MLKLIIVCVTIVLVVKILTKKENDIHKNKIIYNKNAIIKKQNEEKVRQMNKEIKDRTCPKCNKYNPNNYDGFVTDPNGLYDCFECKECGTTWKIRKCW